MKTIILTAVLITAFLAADLLPSAAQSAEQLYQKGLMKEEGEGALQDAIDLYNQVADNSSASTSLRAKSLLHIGMCFEKLGTQEAVKAYQRLVSSFPSQKNEVAIARERLNRLIKPVAEKLPDTPLIPEFIKVKMPGNPGNGMLSPDGKKIAFISGGDVWVVPVSGGVNPYITGEPDRLTRNINAWDNMINSFCWSGNGKWIAFNAEPGKSTSSTSIYVIPSGGGNPQKVQVPSHYCGWPSEFRLSLSPDGKTLAYASGWVDYNTRTTKIYTIPVNGNEARELTEPGTWDPAWSPDGSRIAFVKFSRDNERNEYTELLVIPAKGGSPKKLTDRQLGQIRGPVWSPDGKMIAYIKRPSMENPKEIWLIQLTDEGDPVGTPRKVDLPMESYHTIAGWTPDNKIGIQLTNPEYEIIYTVPATGGIATQVTPQGWTSYPKWSPDGKRIFYRGTGSIISVPSQGGAVDTIQIDSEFVTGTAVPGSGNEISPDGKTIVFAGMKNFYVGDKKNWEVDIFTVPVEGGKPEQLTSISNELQDRFPCWSPDGHSIAFIRPEIIDKKFFFMHIYTISRDGENLTKITDRSDSVAWAPIDWTQDGKSITYFSTDNAIRSIPAEGGESKFITDIDSTNSQYDLAWSPDGTELAYTDKGKIWIYDPASGKTEEVKTGVAEHATKLGWSPDGQKIAFTAYGGGDAGLWLMENFLPLEKLGPENVYSEPPLKPKFTKIKIPTRLSPSVVLSPDGKTLAHVADKKIWITPLTGNVGPGFPGKPFQLNTGDVEVEWTGLAWSCDGKWIAFNEDPAQRRRDGDTTAGEIIQGIYIVPSGGGEPRKILENYRDARVVNYLISLSPDGKTLAHTSVENKEQHLYLTTVDGGSSKRLVEMQARGPSFSPDGKMIAFVLDKGLGRGEGDLGLWIIPAMGGTPRLLADAGKAACPVWSPDGSMIAFLDDTKNKQVNIVELKNGPDITGKVNTIDLPEGTGNIITLAGWTPNNKLGLLINSDREYSLFTLPTEGGQAAIISADCYAFQPRWSRDGKQVYYVKPPREGENRFNKMIVETVPAKGGTGTSLPGEYFGKTVHQLPYMSGNRISPDGKMILTAAFTSADTSGVNEWPNSKIWKISLDGKEAEQLTFAQGRISDMCPTWSPDGKKIAFIRTSLKEGTEVYDKTAIYTVNLSGGEPVLLIPETDDYVFSLVWSPDGKMIAFTTRNPRKTGPERIGLMKIVDVADGTIRIMGEVQGATVNTELAWSQDSKRIAFNQNNKICVMNVSDGKTEEITTGLVDTDIWHLDWSADGKQFVFFGMEGGKTEFWFMEDFLPLEKLAQKKEKEDMLIRKTLPDTDIEPLGTPSPDGRYLTFIDWNSGGNVGILNLETKERRLLTDLKDSQRQAAYYTSWSPDGKQIAYFWWKSDKDQNNLSIVDVDKGESRDLLISDKYDWIELGNWSSDGKHIVATFSVRGRPESQIMLISTADGSTEVLKTFDKSYLEGKPRLSPDDRFVAFNLQDENAAGNSDIYLLSLANKQLNVLSKDPSHDYMLGWTPDGKYILYASDKRGTVDAMIVRVEGGRPAADPKPVAQNIGPIVPLGITQSGSFYYGQWTNAEDIYTAEIDIDEFKLMEKPAKLIQQFEGKNYAPDYSSDGKHVAYISDRGVLSRGEAGRVLCIRNLETDDEQQIIPEAGMEGIYLPQWSPDDNSIALMCDNKDGYSRIYIYDTGTRQFKPLVTESPDDVDYLEYANPQWSPDGKSVYYSQISRYSTTSRAMVRDIETGVEKELYSYSSDDFMDRIFIISISPDGKWLAAINRGPKRWVRLISAKDGETRDLYSFENSGGFPLAPVWSSNGKYIVFPCYEQMSNGKRKWNLMRIPSEGGEPVSIGLNVIRIDFPDLHPDGRHLIFSSAGYSFPESNIWEMKNFIPE